MSPWSHGLHRGIGRRIVIYPDNKKFIDMNTALNNKTTLVTGVSSGIGREIAQLLAERGARVFGTVRNPQSGSPIPGVEVVRMEVTDDASVNETIQSIVQKTGPVRILVN